MRQESTSSAQKTQATNDNKSQTGQDIISDEGDQELIEFTAKLNNSIKPLSKMRPNISTKWLHTVRSRLKAHS